MTLTPTAPAWPDENGYFGPFGGRFVPESLMTSLTALAKAWDEARSEEGFWRDLLDLLQQFAGRPTPLTVATRLSRGGGATILLKREDLTAGGSHHLNHCLGQALMARRLGCERVVTDTGSGLHGAAAASACARLGLPCTVFMGSVDAQRQSHNVLRMEALGATVQRVSAGAGTLREAVTEAMRAWAADAEGVFYMAGSAVGPHPYPAMVRDFQTIVGTEALRQMRERPEGLPAAVVASVGRGGSALGTFYAFVPEPAVRLVAVEAGGASAEPGQHAATLRDGQVGVFHGMHTLLLQDGEGLSWATRTAAVDLDYPAVGPEMASLKQSGRLEIAAVSDAEALAACRRLAREEGILASLEAGHALAEGLRRAAALDGTQTVLVCLCGAGDKDVAVLRLEASAETSEPQAAAAAEPVTDEASAGPVETEPEAAAEPVKDEAPAGPVETEPETTAAEPVKDEASAGPVEAEPEAAAAEPVKDEAPAGDGANAAVAGEEVRS